MINSHKTVDLEPGTTWNGAGGEAKVWQGETAWKEVPTQEKTALQMVASTLLESVRRCRFGVWGAMYEETKDKNT